MIPPHVLFIVGGLAFLVIAAFLIAIPLGCAAFGAALLFVGLTSVPAPRSPKE